MNSISSALSAETLSWPRNRNREKPERWQTGDWKVGLQLPRLFLPMLTTICFSLVVNPEDEVGFTVYKGHAYCESCHVRLRMPKCKKCKKSIRPGDQAVEAMGGKWCWNCFVCTVSPYGPFALLRSSIADLCDKRCDKPFDDPQFYEQGKRPFCRECYSIVLVQNMD